MELAHVIVMFVGAAYAGYQIRWVRGHDWAFDAMDDELVDAIVRGRAAPRRRAIDSYLDVHRAVGR